MDLRLPLLIASLAASSTCLAVDTVVEGRLLDKRAVAAPGPAQQLATILTAAGDRVVLDLGAPGGEATLHPGDRVRVAGRPGLRNGRRVFLVARVEPEPRGRSLAEVVGPPRMREPSARARALFCRLDRDANGYLSDAELWSVRGTNSPWFALDRNGDGRISLNEFGTLPKRQ
jgi:hypothetical protein